MIPMMKIFLFLSGVAVTLFLTVFATTSKAMSPIHGNELQACIESCQVLVDGPMYDLKKCVARCQSRYGKSAALAASCETYEPGCQRPGDGDEDGRDDRDQEDAP